MRLNCDKYSDQWTCCLVSKFGGHEIFEIFVVGDDINQRSQTFEVVLQNFEGFEDHE